MFGFGAKTDEKYMKAALKEAEKAYRDNDVPIGCVIINREGKIIARAHNRRNRDGSTLAHAELLAIGQACKKVKDWRLEGCTMYVTLEPCQMCAGALVQARIDKVVIGCMNRKAGCCGSVLNLLQMQEFNHQVEITSGVLQEECSSIISDFFKEIREEKQQLKAQEEQAQELIAQAADPAEEETAEEAAKESGGTRLFRRREKEPQIPASGMTDEISTELIGETIRTKERAEEPETTQLPAGTDPAADEQEEPDQELQMDDLLRAALEEEREQVRE